MRKALLSAAMVVASFGIAVPAQAQLVTNGGFETGNFTGWTGVGNTTFNGVQCPGPGANVDQGNCSSFFGPVGSTGGITQTLSTTSGNPYTVYFSLLTDGGTPSSFLASFGGNTLLSLTNPSASGGFTDYSFLVLATGPSSVLSFSFRDDPGFLLLDSVSVVEGAVPEPATWAMMLVGFGAMGFAMRRRRARQVAEIAV